MPIGHLKRIPKKRQNPVIFLKIFNEAVGMVKFDQVIISFNKNSIVMSHASQGDNLIVKFKLTI